MKALEKATARHCSVGEIIRNKNFLKKDVLAHIRFLDETREHWVVNHEGNVGESRIRSSLMVTIAG